MIDHREAVRIAKEHVAEVFREDGGERPTLEEIWYDEFGGVWHVTLGIRHRFESRNSILGSSTKVADYKTVRISAKDGRVLSVKVREVAQ